MQENTFWILINFKDSQFTFFVKTEEPLEQIKESIKAQATSKYKIKAVVDSYMSSIEEIINVQSDSLQEVMDEIIIQSKVEFNYTKDYEEEPREHSRSSIYSLESRIYCKNPLIGHSAKDTVLIESVVVVN